MSFHVRLVACTLGSLLAILVVGNVNASANKCLNPTSFADFNKVSGNVRILYRFNESAPCSTSDTCLVVKVSHDEGKSYVVFSFKEDGYDGHREVVKHGTFKRNDEGKLTIKMESGEKILVGVPEENCLIEQANNEVEKLTIGLNQYCVERNRCRRAMALPSIYQPWVRKPCRATAATIKMSKTTMTMQTTRTPTTKITSKPEIATEPPIAETTTTAPIAETTITIPETTTIMPTTTTPIVEATITIPETTTIMPTTTTTTLATDISGPLTTTTSTITTTMSTPNTAATETTKKDRPKLLGLDLGK